MSEWRSFKCEDCGLIIDNPAHVFGCSRDHTKHPDSVSSPDPERELYELTCGYRIEDAEFGLDAGICGTPSEEHDPVWDHTFVPALLLLAGSSPDYEAAAKPLREIQLVSADGGEGLDYYKPYELERLAAQIVRAALGYEETE